MVLGVFYIVYRNWKTTHKNLFRTCKTNLHLSFRNTYWPLWILSRNQLAPTENDTPTIVGMLEFLSLLPFPYLEESGENWYLFLLILD